MFVLAGGHVTSITSIPYPPQPSPPPSKICVWVLRPLQTTSIQRANSRSRRRVIKRDATPPRMSRSSSATTTRSPGTWYHCQKGSGLKNLNLNNQTKTKHLNFAARSCKSPKICHLLHHHDPDHLLSSRVWIEVWKKSFKRGKRRVYEKWWWHQPRVIFIRLHGQVESAPLRCLWVFLSACKKRSQRSWLLSHTP